MKTTSSVDHHLPPDTIEEFTLDMIPENGVCTIDLHSSYGRKLFSVSISRNGVAFQVLPAGESMYLYTTTENEV
mgnify:CR=1 FL=1